MNRFLYKIYLVVGSLGHWLRRRLTPAGWMVFIGLILAAGLGADPERAIAYQSFAILFSLLAMAMLCAPFFRARLSATRTLPRFGTAGHPLTYLISVRNESQRPQSGLCVLENMASAPLTYDEFLGVHGTESRGSFRLVRPRPALRSAVLKDTPVPSVPARSETTVTAELIPMKRGLLQLAGLTLARADPLGLFRAFSNIPLPQSVLVLPRRYPLPPIPLPGSRKYQLGGVALAMSVGESEEFVSLREYRRGDPLRHIHWKSWAKTGQPIVREFEDEYFVRHALILDTFAKPAQWEAFEEAVAVAASFACTVNTQESLLDLMFVGPQAFCFTVGRGLAHAEQMLEVLASVQPCRDKKFSDLEHMVLEHAEAVSGCICVLLGWDEERQQLVKRLRSLGVPMLILVIADPETKIAADGEEIHFLEVGKVREGLQSL